MISTPQAKAKTVHPLARFVTKEAIALLLKVEVAQIKDIRCWPNVILVVGQGLSKFVSYADMPPILGVKLPTNQDFVCWRKRWKKLEKKQAPDFWVRFYAQKFGYSLSVAELYSWGQLVHVIKCALSEKAVLALRSIYTEERYCLENVYVGSQTKNGKQTRHAQPNHRAASLAW